MLNSIRKLESFISRPKTKNITIRPPIWRKWFFCIHKCPQWSESPKTSLHFERKAHLGKNYQRGLMAKGLRRTGLPRTVLDLKVLSWTQLEAWPGQDMSWFLQNVLFFPQEAVISQFSPVKRAKSLRLRRNYPCLSVYWQFLVNQFAKFSAVLIPYRVKNEFRLRTRNSCS